MTKPGLLYCVTDKELYDGLMSAKQHFTPNTLLELARSRGIFYSAAEGRPELADRLSMLIFGCHELHGIQAAFETAGRAEKTTSFRLNTPLTQGDIKAIADDYREAVGNEEKVVTHPIGSKGFAVDLTYTEIDFSKTRLRQRQTREARIEFKIESDHTIVTLPANDKAREAVEQLRDRLYAKKQANIGLEEIDFSKIAEPRLRTTFFTRLISSLSGLTLQDVMRIKENRPEKSTPLPDDEDTEEETDETSEEMLGIVKAIALHGQSLLSSPEYQAFHKRGFFITSITWSARKATSPYEIVEFEAGFEDPTAGTGFKYSVRGWYTQRQGDYTKNIKPVPPDDKNALLSIIEQVANTVFRDISTEHATAQAKSPIGGTT
jgi:hypothetical protein